MSHLHLVMPLRDFYAYIADIVAQHHGSFFLQEKRGSTIVLTRITAENADAITDDRAQYLGFHIFSVEKDRVARDAIYDDALEPVVIDGEGGRVNAQAVERIALRILSKTPDANTKKLFNAIKARLKKDAGIGMGVEGGSKLHDGYFYQKALVGKKLWKTDFHNAKAPLVVAKSA